MANSPIPAEHDVVVQNTNTGEVDFLHFHGAQLAASAAENYISPGWKIVASGDFNGDGHPDVVAQNTSTGQLDFLFLNASGALIGSALSNVNVPTVHGAGSFGASVSGQMGAELVSQLPNGSVDLLAFSAGGVLLVSDMIPNTAGLAPIVGVGGSQTFFPIFNNVGGANDSIMIQLADGTLDALGFSGSFATTTVQLVSSLMLPGTAGSPTVGALNQDFDVDLQRDANVTAMLNGSTQETVEMVGSSSTGQIDHLFFDSGYNELPILEGAEIGALAENFTLAAGWQIVDGGIVAHNDFFHPI